MKNSVVITGIGSILPTGEGIESLRDAIIHEKSSIGPLKSDSIHNTESFFFGNITDQTTGELAKKVPRKLKKFCSREMIWSLNASEMAITDSGIDLDNIATDRRGIFSYMGGHRYPFYKSFPSAIDRSIKNNEIDLKTLTSEIIENKSGDPFSCIKGLINVTLGINSIFKQFKGDCGTFTQSESGVIGALKNAITSIQYGLSDIALIIFSGTEKDLFSLEDGFDNGYVFGEGSVAFILESLESAQKRNAHIYLKIDGAETYVQKDQSIKFQNPYRICFDKISKNSGINLSDLNFIFNQGMGTNSEDSYESAMLHDLLKNNNSIPVLNITPLTGYITGVSMIVNILVCALLQKYKTFPQINKFKRALGTNLSLLNEKTEIEDYQHAGILGFTKDGFHSMVLLSRP